MAEDRPLLENVAHMDADGNFHVTSSQTKDLRTELAKIIRAKKEVEENRLGRKLKPKEVSDLRRFIGEVTIDGIPVNLKGVRSAAKGANMVGLEPSKKVVPSEKIGTRKFWSEEADGYVLRQAKKLNPKIDDQGNVIRESRWPKGKSLDGFKKWMAQGVTRAMRERVIFSKRYGIQAEMGHGWSVSGEGTPIHGSSSLDNTAPQPAERKDSAYITYKSLVPNRPHKQNRALGDLMRAGILGVDIKGAFQTYLMEGTSPKVVPFLRLTPEQRSQVLFSPKGTAEDLQAQFVRELENLAGEAFYRKANPTTKIKVKSNKQKTSDLKKQGVIKLIKKQPFLDFKQVEAVAKELSDDPKVKRYNRTKAVSGLFKPAKDTFVDIGGRTPPFPIVDKDFNVNL